MRDRIDTERLSLRALRLADAPFIAKYSSEPDIARRLSSLPYPNPTLAVEMFILQCLSAARRGKGFAYAITQKGYDVPIGIISLFEGRPKEWELGYWLGKDFWGLGLMSQAGHALLTQAQRQLSGQIHACCHIDNPASARLLEKFGFAAHGQVKPCFSLAQGRKVSTQYYRFKGLALAKAS